MHIQLASVTFALSLVASVYASPAPSEPTDQSHLGTAIGGALDSTHAAMAPAPTAGPNVQVEAASGPMTIVVHNSAKIPVTVTYGLNSGFAAPISQPTPGILSPGRDLQVVAPTGWAGRIIVGNNMNVDNSKIEGSLISQNGAPAQPNIDVSYVDGYSVPIVCACDGKVKTGCNKPLFQMNTCGHQGPGPICYNPEVNNRNGPAAPFFAPCAHMAYTYPADDLADAGCASHTIHCCVGPSCPAYGALV